MSNYETMKDRMSSHFLEYDQEKMIRKFALEHDEKYLYIFFVGRKYRINRITGGITWSVDEFQTEENANYNEAMTIYDVLCNSKEYCHPAHEWVHISAAFLRYGEEIWQMTVTFSGMQERNSMERLQNLQKPASGCMGSGWKKAMWLTSWNCFRFFPLY